MTDARYMRPGLPFAVGKAIEECGEVLSALGKTLRWGWDSVNPELPPEQQETNEAWVRREMADLRGALDNLERELDCRCRCSSQYRMRELPDPACIRCSETAALTSQPRGSEAE